MTDYAQRWRDRGVLAFEMEASALFFLAARAGVQAACALIVSDVLSEEVTPEDSYLPLDELDQAIDRMIGSPSMLASRRGGRLEAMTETIPRGAANQAGANINKNADAQAQDFLPLNGIDHVEFWVGNATRPRTTTAPCGASRGRLCRVWRRACATGPFVMVQNDIRFVFTAPISPDGEIAEHVASMATGCRTSRSRSTTSTRPGRRRRSAAPRPGADDARGQERRPSPVRLHAYGEVIHSFVDRSDYHGVLRPRLPPHHEAGARRRAARSCWRSTTASATSRSAT